MKGRKKEGRAGGEDGDAQPSGRLQGDCLTHKLIANIDNILFSPSTVETALFC